MTLLAAFQLLLGRLSGQEDFAIGSPIAGRTRREIEPLIGYFLNNLVLRADLSGDPRFTELLSRVRETTLGAFAHQEIPFEKLVEELRPPRDLSRTPFFQVLFNLVPPLGAETVALEGVAGEVLGSAEAEAKFDVTLYVAEGDRIQLRLVYNTDLFEAATAERMLQSLEVMLEAVIEQPERRISTLPLLRAAERERLAVAGAEEPRPEVSFEAMPVEVLERSIGARFAEVVRKNPDAVAVDTARHRWSYAELERRSYQVAHALLRHCGAGEARVALLVEHDAPMLAAVLGALQAGLTYVPLDPGFPEARLRRILQDAEASVILTEARHAAELGGWAGETPVLVLEEVFAQELEEPLEREVSPEVPAYLLYTSGSTGEPKGVVQSQRNVLHHVRTYVNRLHIGAEDRLSLLSSYGFDAAVMDIYGALLSGATLVPIDLRSTAAADLPRQLRELGVSVYHSTPTVYRHLLSQLRGGDGEEFTSVRLVVLGGEEVVPRDVEFFRRHFAPECLLVNGLGPTECTLALQQWIGHETPLPRRGVPVGRAVEGVEVGLLNDAGEPVEIYATGEIVLRTRYLAQGYWKRPEQTAAAFLPDPNGGERRVYHTGDLGRLLPDGSIAFRGRKDAQLKVRGYRIEAAEIEGALLRHPMVREAVVLVREVEGERQLVGYVVAEEGEWAPSAAELRAYLRSRLPEYMVPAAYGAVERIPLTPNGKVDRRSLLAREAEGEVATAAYVAPRTQTEELVAGIWQEVLGVERVGAHDNFHELGGHSLLAMQVVSRVRSVLQVELPLRTLFEAPTVAGLAERIEALQRGGNGVGVPPLVRAPRDAPLPLSFAQRRLWFLQQMEPQSSTYNIHGAVRLTGAVDVEALERSFGEVVRRHESLRTVFRVVEGEPVQVVLPAVDPGLEVVDLSGLPSGEREAEMERRRRETARWVFDLKRGPLFKASLLPVSDEEHVLLVVMHHVITDGWSLRLLNRELRALYAAYSAGEASPLPELEVQYADYAQWQRQYLSGEVLEGQLGYWREQLAEVPALELPADRPRPPVQTHRGAAASIELDPWLSNALGRLSRREDATLFMTLLAGLQILLGRLSGQERFAVGTPIAGRTRAEIEPLIGFFLNNLVLRADLSGDPSFRDLLARVRETTLGAYAHQEIPFETLIEELRPPRDLSRTPFFQVLFNMLPEHEGEQASFGSATAEAMGGGEAEAKFDLTLYVVVGERVRLRAVYNTDLFAAERIERLLRQYEHLLRQVVEDRVDRVSGYTLIDAEAAACLPDPAAPLAGRWSDSLAARVSAQAARTPLRTAVSDGCEAWSYAELEEGSNRLAHRLIGGGVGRGDTVAVYAERSASLVVALLGVLKAGAAFVILNSSYPAQRLRQSLSQLQLGGWIGMEAAGAVPAELREEVEPIRCRLSLPAGKQALLAMLAGEPGRAPEVEIGPADLAYVTFTSGTTGVPKGILGTHAPLSHFLEWHAGTFELGEHDRFSVLSGLSHDPLLRDLFAPLWVGATACMPSAESREDPAALFEWLRSERVTVAHLTPAMAEVIALGGVAARAEARLPDLRAAFFGGDVLRGEQIAALRRLAPGVRCVNFYGATETPQAIAYHGVEADAVEGEAIPIGRGIDGVQLLVLNGGDRLCGIGEVGEICVRTPYLALGYLNDAGLTADRFTINPLSGDPVDRVYRTGDRGRYRPDGSVEFAGRADGQLNIRGYRVERTEIEAVLGQHPSVRRAVVLGRERTVAEVELVAFVVSVDGAAPLPDELRGWLHERLPAYMVPVAFGVVEAIPLTPNGKVDRARLLGSAELSAGGEAAFVAPRTQTEELVAGIWQAVLGVEGVGARDNFHDLGGHSLRAIQVVSRIRSVFQVELPLRTLFEAPTVAGLAEQIETLQRGGPRMEAPPLVRVPRDAPLPLSFAQQRLWFLHQMEPQSSAYNLRGAVRLRGALDVGALEWAVVQTVRRHESLRTVFRARVGVAEQVVLEAERSGVGVEVVDLSGLAGEAREAAEAEWRSRAAAWTFDLSSGPLLRIWLLRLEAEQHVLLVVMHHIITDGWSLRIFTRELATLYSAFSSGQPSPLTELEIQYADYAAWQRRFLADEVVDAQLSYWKRQLADPSTLELPTDRPRPAIQTTRGDSTSLELSPEMSDALRCLAREEGATLFMALLAAFQLLLSRLSNQDDVLVGAPVAGRNRREIEPLIGFFVNTLVLRADLSGDPSFRELLDRVRKTATDAYAHQELPFEKLVEELNPPRDLSRSPFFQALFTMMPDGAGEKTALGEVSAEVLGGTEAEAKFELTMFVSDRDTIRFGLVYNADLFERDTIRDWIDAFRLLLEGIVADRDRPVSSIPLLSSEKRDRVLATSRGITTGMTIEKTVSELWLAQAKRTPGAEAVVHGEDRLTYADLLSKANQLARWLRARGIGRGSRVAIAMDRSPDLVVSVLGILGAGAAYVPLDPSYPALRLRYMLQNSGARMLLSGSGLEQSLSAIRPDGVEIVVVDRISDRHVEESGGAIDFGVGRDDLAYVIYTSGSTGEPKGVAMSHGPLVNLVRWHNVDAVRTESPRTLAFAPISFDVSFQEIFTTLSSGGTLILVGEEERRDPDLLLERIEAEHVQHIFLPFVALQQFAEACVRADRVPESLREVYAAGEQLQVTAAIAALFRRLPDCRLHNQYGPTESHVVTAHTLMGQPAAWPSLPSIGKPIANASAFVLDARMQPVPRGVVGELFLGGAVLAQGYLDRPDLTAERFVPDPFAPKGRLYRTGDLARWTTMGDLEFLGRADQQVKIRGFRIEPGEIEAVLVRHPGVREAAVIAREEGSGEKRLVAYTVVDPDAPSGADELRNAVASVLPDYMVPSAFVLLDALPLTPSGKLDRRALPAPDRGPDQETYVAPRTAIEELLCEAWAGVLELDRVGVNDNFFELGGHSLLATRLISRIRSITETDLPLRLLFEAPTVARLAAELDRNRHAGPAADPIRPIPPGREAPIPLSFAQQRLWFLQAMDPETTAFNLSGATLLSGPLDESSLRRAFKMVVDRHAALRTMFRVVEGEPVQVIRAAKRDVLEVIDATGSGSVQRAEMLKHYRRQAHSWRFDLENGPVLRAWLLRLADDEHVLLVAVHHIAVDGVSLRILVRELCEIYTALTDGRAPKLPSLPVQYADYAVWQRDHLSERLFAAQLAHWRERLGGLPVLELPTDRPRPAEQSHRGGTVSLALGDELSDALARLGRDEGATPFMTLLAAFQILLARWSGQRDFGVGSPIAGRTRAEIEPLIGLFLNNLVLRADLSGEPTFRQLIRRVRSTTLDAYANQDIPFERLIEELRPVRDQSRTPLFQVLFNMLPDGDEGAAFGAATSRVLGGEAPQAKFDLTLYVRRAASIRLNLVFAMDLFDRETAERMLADYVGILAEVVAHPNVPLRFDNPMQDANGSSESVVAGPGLLLRGYRIDTEVVRSALLAEPNVEDAAVFALDALDRPVTSGVAEKLVGFVRRDGGSTEMVGDLVERMRIVLPPHLFPSILRAVADAPSELEPDRIAELVGGNGVSPTDETPKSAAEALIARLWAELLGIEEIGVHDNFYDLGGHSLLAVRFVARYEKAAGRRVNVRELTYQTLRQLAAANPPAEPEPSRGLVGRFLDRIGRSDA
jgi:amino acid adenylation domain-containing protein